MGIRRKSRELALQSLYQSEINKIPAEESLLQLIEHFEINKKAIPYALELVRGVAGRWSDINSLIEENAANWRINRMSLIDRNILRLAVYEMYCSEEPTPSSVVIDEAIEISRRFSTDDAGSFINGILDAVRKSRTAKPEK